MPAIDTQSSMTVDDFTDTSRFPPEVDIKAIRLHLGLTRERLGRLLETDAHTIQRMEMAPGVKSRREPAARMLRLLDAYLGGWRPTDWPEDTP